MSHGVRHAPPSWGDAVGSAPNRFPFARGFGQRNELQCVAAGRPGDGVEKLARPKRLELLTF